MSRAKSVVPQKGKQKDKKQPLANVQCTLQEENTSFDLSSKNRSPVQRGPIKVYEKYQQLGLSKSGSKRQGSNIRKPQFKEEHSNERLRLSNTNIEALTFNASQINLNQTKTVVVSNSSVCGSSTILQSIPAASTKRLSL